MLGQFSMVNLELFNIVEDIKKVSKAFVVYPKNVNVDNAASMFSHTILMIYVEVRSEIPVENGHLVSESVQLNFLMKIDV